MIAYVITNPAVHEDHGSIEYIYTNAEWARAALQRQRKLYSSDTWVMEEVVIENHPPQCPHTVIVGQLGYECEQTGEHDRHTFKNGEIQWNATLPEGK